VQSSNSNGGLIGLLVQAVVDQVVNTLSDRSYPEHGPRHPRVRVSFPPS